MKEELKLLIMENQRLKEDIQQANSDKSFDKLVNMFDVTSQRVSELKTKLQEAAEGQHGSLAPEVVRNVEAVLEEYRTTKDECLKLSDEILILKSHNQALKSVDTLLYD